MKFEYYGKSPYSVIYKVELLNSLDVAEFGEQSKTMEIPLPYYFDMRNKDLMDKMFEKLEPIMIENNFDTVLLQREQYEDFTYYLTKGDDN